jgi:hypothetical protein
MAYFKVLSWHVPTENEKNHGNPIGIVLQPSSEPFIRVTTSANLLSRANRMI